jgi:BMFP domain-containing protein YqiC
MQPNNRFFDDLARMTSGAMGAMAGMRSEVEGLFRSRFERLVADLDLVKREEFEAVRAMAAKARAEQEDMAIRLAGMEAKIRELEARLAATSTESASPGANAAAATRPRRSRAKPTESA